ncbi:MAG: hypothetical protein ACOYL6_09155 [Bacteriovoracaceae bacterium]
MKISVLMLFLCANVMAAGKTYTEEDFKKSVDSEVDRRIKRLNSNNIAELTKEIMTKEDNLKLKEKELKGKEEQLSFNARELEKKIKDFELEQKRILGCMDKNKADSEKRVQQMIEVVGNMKPEKAAELLSTQESDLAVRIIAGLEAKKSSKIFNLMDKAISARLQKQYLDMKK